MTKSYCLSTNKFRINYGIKHPSIPYDNLFEAIRKHILRNKKRAPSGVDVCNEINDVAKCHWTVINHPYENRRIIFAEPDITLLFKTLYSL